MGECRLQLWTLELFKRNSVVRRHAIRPTGQDNPARDSNAESSDQTTIVENYGDKIVYKLQHCQISSPNNKPWVV